MMNNVRFTLKKIWLSVSSYFDKTYTTNKCPHTSKKKGLVKVGDDIKIVTLPLAENGNLDYCVDCISNMTIQCAWCDNLIPTGSPITLYSPREEDFKVPEHAVVYGDQPLQLVGCLRSDCVIIEGDRAGFWLPGDDGKGYVHRVPTAMELFKNNPALKGLIIGNTNDINEAENTKVF